MDYCTVLLDDTGAGRFQLHLCEVQEARVVGRGSYGKGDISISETSLMVILTDLQMDVPDINI